MEEFNFAEYSEVVEKQLPLMYMSSFFVFLGVIILLIWITEILFSYKEKKSISKSEKKRLIALSITFGSLVAGFGIYFFVMLRVANDLF